MGAATYKQLKLVLVSRIDRTTRDVASGRLATCKVGEMNGSKRSNDTRAQSVDASFSALYREHGAFVLSFGARLLGPGHDSQDLAQDVFLIALKKWHPQVANPRAWLATITYGLAANVRRRQWLKGIVGWSGEVKAALDDIIDWETPEQALVGRQTLSRLYGILDQLPEKSRAVLIMSELQGMTPKEIAAVTGEALTTIYSRLQKARERCALIHRRLEARDE